MENPTKQSVLAAVLVLYVLCGHIWAREVWVPSEYGTIQTAIDNSIDGDVVIVADGTYTGEENKNIDFGGRAMTLRSQNGPQFTIIDCENDGRAFYFHTGEDMNAVVEGFTITNGSMDRGAGIYCDNGSPTINDCIFTENSVQINGGAIYTLESSPVVAGCTFRENRAGEHAGGIYCTNSSALVSGCVFIANSCYNFSADGGAMFNAGEISPTIENCLFIGNKCGSDGAGGAIRNYKSSPSIINCTFAANSGTYGGALANTPESSPAITNCILWGNSAFRGNEIYNAGSCHPTVTCCDIKGGWNGSGVYNGSGCSVIDGGGNINADPEFAVGSMGGYYLSQTEAGQGSDSPCVDAGNDLASSLGLDQYTTRTDQVTDTGMADMGYHYPVVTLIGFEITGPDEVAEDFQTQYKAIAYYDNNSARDVTDSALWAVEPNDVAGIEAGLLTTGSIGWPGGDVTIYAEYTEGEVTLGAEKLVTVFPVCPTGTALQFDGVDDYVEIGDKLNDVDSPFSIAAWVNKRGEGSQPIFTSDNFGSGNYYGLWLYIQNDNTLQISYGDGSGEGPTARRTKVSSSSVQNNRWTFVAAVVRGAVDMDLYIDGVNVGGFYSGSGGDMVHSTHKAVIGLLRTSVAYYFNGTMDEVAIWNRALSAEEIRANMHRRLTGYEPSLVGYWDFDEGEGQIAYDLSGNGNHSYLGSDPCGVDDSDPAWIESDAPVGICTPYLIAKRAVERGIAHKMASLAELQAALAEEAVSLDALDDMFRSGNFSDLKKGDIVQAKQMIHSAMQHEQQAQNAVQKGIEKLTASLALLGCEVEPQAQPEPQLLRNQLDRKSDRADISEGGRLTLRALRR